ncbi:hypothetical protein ccbrp13_20240 [Ktedonobacteria bacterium brp13]|nr:hypothetical protein ccbrp13_20240 [Ktedonobacteria bacterium brp13]
MCSFLFTVVTKYCYKAQKHPVEKDASLQDEQTEEKQSVDDQKKRVGGWREDKRSQPQPGPQRLQSIIERIRVEVSTC